MASKFVRCCQLSTSSAGATKFASSLLLRRLSSSPAANPFVARRHFWKLAGVTAATAGGLGLWFALEKSTAGASDLFLHPPSLPWNQHKKIGSFDAASVRRGYTVYKQVCAACHTLEQVTYLQFVDRFMTKAEALKEAEEHMYLDGPGEDGKMFERPGMITDFMPEPYKNVVEAKLANNGAAPPDLSLVVLQNREKGGENYIFHLLTGYPDEDLGTPAGVVVEEGQAYNPYFLGGVLSMPQQLFDEGVEFDDNTVATQSQQAKDVSNFLAFCSEPYLDDYKMLLSKVLVTFPVFAVGIFVWAKYNTCWLKFEQLGYITGHQYRKGLPKARLPNGPAFLSPHKANDHPKIV